jgi:MoxR-like ATPase
MAAQWQHDAAAVPSPLPSFVPKVALRCCLQGNCLLVGVGGSGKQSLARLAAYAAGCGVFEITLTRGYDEVAFREDLKKLYTMLGAENKKMVFLFTDSHVADEGFLELINNMLTTGERRLHAACIHVCMPRTEFTQAAPCCGGL